MYQNYLDWFFHVTNSRVNSEIYYSCPNGIAIFFFRQFFLISFFYIKYTTDWTMKVQQIRKAINSKDKNRIVNHNNIYMGLYEIITMMVCKVSKQDIDTFDMNLYHYRVCVCWLKKVSGNNKISQSPSST